VKTSKIEERLTGFLKAETYLEVTEAELQNTLHVVKNKWYVN